MPVVYPRRHVLNPPAGTGLNMAHPLTYGLEAKLAFNEGGGTRIYDWLNPNVVLTPAGTFAWSSSPVGAALEFNGTANSLTLSSPGTRYLLPTRRTIAAWARFDASDELRMLIQHSHGNDHSWRFGLHWGALELSIIQSFSTATISDSSQTWTGKWRRFVGVDRNGTLELWVDGVLIKSQASAVTYVGPALSNVVIGNYSSIWLDGAIADLTLWNRDLSGSEIRQDYAEPFGMFLP